MRYKNIIFDLDGTLIDSAPGIVEAFSYAFKKIYKVQNTVDIKSLIGPPINEVLFAVNGETNQRVINEFVSEFKSQYDSVSFKKSRIYDNAIEMLEILKNNKIALFIATNKRELPTRLILDHLKLSNYFKGVYCPDSIENIFENKSKLVHSLISTFNLTRSETLFIGDTTHDGLAAESNGLDFALFNNGYGHHGNPTYIIENFNTILNILE